MRLDRKHRQKPLPVQRLPVCSLFQWAYSSGCNEPGKMKGDILILGRRMKEKKEEMRKTLLIRWELVS
ncbi:hypothetical protein B0T13DRAFT_476529 [Neurospora crassa]|nr:hypothetical protein B0T13DRAFT_476529 [Neurospora crassa]